MSKRIPVYNIVPANNLPEDSEFKYFVFCNLVDMQPYLSYDICAKDYDDAIFLVGRNAMINKFSEFKVKVEENF